MFNLRKIHILSIFLIFLAFFSSSCNSSRINEVVLAGPSKIEKLQVVFATPDGPVQEQSELDAITVSFNQAMVPLTTLPEDEPEGLLTFEPPLSGKYRWMGTATLKFIPDNPLPFGTLYHVTVPKGFKALTGAVLDKDYKWSFETVRPAIVSSKPAEYFYNRLLALKGSIYLLFNQPMDPAKAADFIELSCDKKIIPVKVDRQFEKDKDTEEWDPNNVIVIKPSELLSPGKAYILTLKKNLPGKTGDLGLSEDNSITFNSENVFKFSGMSDADTSGEHSPESSIDLTFTNPVDYGEVIDNIKFTPDIKIPEYYKQYGQNQTLCLYVPLLAQTKYTVKISKNIKDILGNTLGQDVSFSFKTSDYSPSCYIENGVGTVEANSSRTFPVSFMNLDKVNLKLASLSKDQIIPLFQGHAFNYDAKYNPGENFYKIDREWKLNLKKNQSWWQPVDMDELLGDKKYGFVFLQLDALETLNYDSRFQKAFLQVTNLGITAKFSPENNIISVNTLDTAQPVPDALVELRNSDNKIIWTGKTDGQGMVETDGWNKLKLKEDDSEIWVFASKGDDMCVSSSYRNWRVPLYMYDYYYDSSDFNIHVFTEKGIYRAGEEVHLKGTMREKIKGKWEVSSLKKLNLKISSSRDEVLVDTPLKLSEYGSFDHSFTIPSDGSSGRYAIYISGEKGNRNISGYGSFLVEDYQAAQYEVTVNSDCDYYVFGDKFNGTVKGWYLFGAPMKGDKVNWSYYLEPTWYSPSGYEDFDFTRDFYDMAEEREEKYLGSGEGNLKDNGEVPLSVEITDKVNQGPYILTVQGTIESAGRQSVSGYKQVLVHPGEYYIGIKPSSRFMSNKETQTFNMIVLSPDGTVRTGQDVKIDIIKREWNSVRKVGMNGETGWVSEKVDEVIKSFDLKSEGQRVEGEFKPDKAGLYIIRATGTDSRKNNIVTESTFYVSGEDYVAWARYDDDKIDLVPDKKEYKPGDTAKILVKSPYEQARALVTIEREFIIKSFWVNLKGSADTVEIPVEEDYLPNVYVSVILLQGRVSDSKFSDTGDDLGKPSFKIGYFNMPVVPDNKRLKVTVNTDKDKYVPGDEVTVNLHMENQKGQGVKGEICVSAVDLGVLNLTGFKTPDYFDSFYYTRGIDVITAETRKYIIDQKNYGQKGGNPGGDGGGKPSTLRENFVATAMFKPSVITDNNGNGSVKFKLPDNVTTFLIMATAQTKDSSFGCGDKRIVSTKPLLMKPSMPRFVRLYDKFKAGVLVFNGTDKEGEAVVECNSEGLKLSERGLKKVDIPPGQEKEVLFSFEADKVTEGKLTFSCTMGTYSDGVLEKLPVKAAILTEAVATTGSSEDNSREEKLSIPATADPNTGYLEVNNSSTAMINLQGGLEYLVDYPYGCLEQKLSRVLPLITAEELINAFDLSGLKGQKLRDFVQENLDMIVKHQKPSGGFTLWEGGELENPFLSAYTMYGLTLAQESDYKISPSVMSEGRKYLKEILRFSKDDKRWLYPYKERTQATVKAFALYTLYLAGEGEPSYLHTMYEQRNKNSLFGRCMLVRAMHMYGKDKEEEAVMVKELLNHIKMSPTSAYFEERVTDDMSWIYTSTVRTTSLTLQTLIELDADFPQAQNVVKWLIDTQSLGRWDTTQENVFAFEALRVYFNKFEKDTPNFESKVSLDGKEIMKNFFKGRETKCVKQVVPMSDIPVGKDMSVMFDKEGPGRQYYTMRLVYAPTDPRPARDEGISVFKSIEPLEGSKTKDFIAGTVYKVTLSIVTPMERHYVVVNDPLPGGFELVRESFDTENKDLLRKLSQIRSNERNDWWGTFDHWENYDDRVLLFADLLNSGEHTFTYFVRAIHYGTFDMPYTKAELMYEPEVFGYSKKETVKVVEK